VLTETFGPHQRSMRGTWAKQPHRIALQGTVGASVSCSICDTRPVACGDLRMSWRVGTPDPQCDNARIAHGLAPSTREDVEALRSKPTT
jgi:uncharacterized protein